jgi:heme/copper-type cytochrome/quinol oxidase subunit 1
MNNTTGNLTALLLYVALFIIALFFSAFIIRKYTRLASNSATRLFAIGFLTTLFLMTISAMWPGNAAFDFQWHDTYWVICTQHLYMAVATVLGFWTLIYYLTPSIIKRNLNSHLTAFHGLFSVITLLSIIMLIVGHGYYFKEVYEKKSPIFEITIFKCLLLFLTTQLIFAINLIYSFIKPQHNQA